MTRLARLARRAEWKERGILHLGWALFLLLFIVDFWWFELGPLRIQKWTFELHLFVIFYAILLFLLCSVLFPDDDDEYADSEEDLRRQWRRKARLGQKPIEASTHQSLRSVVYHGIAWIEGHSTALEAGTSAGLVDLVRVRQGPVCCLEKSHQPRPSTRGDQHRYSVSWAREGASLREP